MSSAQKIIQAAAGNAAGEGLYVEEVFSTYLYAGNGSTQTITNGIDLDGEGGLVWVKERTGAGWHGLVDTERGNTKVLYSNETSAEVTTSGFPSFNSNGFSLALDILTIRNNDSGDDYASWTFRKAPKFFDVVTYTGNGTAGRTVSHNLGATVGTILIKQTNDSADWIVYHRSLGATKNLRLNNTDVVRTETGKFNNTEPTSTEFTLGSDAEINGNNNTFVAYLFAHNDGDGDFGETGDQDIIKCGSYTGNASSDGPEIDLGFEPQWVLIRNADSGAHWVIVDTMRGIVTGGDDPYLRPNAADADLTGNDILSVTPTGFKITGDVSYWNGSSNNHIYIAIRRGPMKTPESGTEVFDVEKWTGDNTSNRILSLSMTPDAVFHAYDRNNEKGSGLRTNVYDRLRGTGYLQTYSTSAQGAATAGFIYLDLMDGVDLGDAAGFAKNETNIDHVGYYFKRAPGFFDVVAYEGNGSARDISHNLGVAPELVIIKNRDSAQNWYVSSPYFTTPANNTLYINDNYAELTIATDTWGVHTDTAIKIGSGGAGLTALNNAANSYIAYLFATLPGVSKVGSYSGTSALQVVDCGFSAGARFLIIKRTDSTSNWYVWDTERGIVTGNDPYLFLNETTAETTNDDYIDPNSSGFELSASSSLNVTGREYIFLAIA